MDSWPWLQYHNSIICERGKERDNERCLETSYHRPILVGWWWGLGPTNSGFSTRWQSKIFFGLLMGFVPTQKNSSPNIWFPLPFLITTINGDGTCRTPLGPQLTIGGNTGTHLSMAREPCKTCLLQPTPKSSKPTGSACSNTFRRVLWKKKYTRVFPVGSPLVVDFHVGD